MSQVASQYEERLASIAYTMELSVAETKWLPNIVEQIANKLERDIHDILWRLENWSVYNEFFNYVKSLCIDLNKENPDIDK